MKTYECLRTVYMLGSEFRSGFCPSRDIWPRLETFFGVTTGGGVIVSTLGVQWVEARSATIHRKAPTAKEDPAPKVNRAEVEIPALE